MFVHLTNRTEFLVHVRLFIKRTNVNELSAERFTNCSLNVRFVYSPICTPSNFILLVFVHHKFFFGFRRIIVRH
ncbi:hypothetical protein Hanom_Chr09g00857241 [Helianthus anomalus]